MPLDAVEQPGSGLKFDVAVAGMRQLPWSEHETHTGGKNEMKLT